MTNTNQSEARNIIQTDEAATNTEATAEKKICVNCGCRTRDIPRIDYTIKENIGDEWKFPEGGYICYGCEEDFYAEAHLDGERYCPAHGFVESYLNVKDDNGEFIGCFDGCEDAAEYDRQVQADFARQNYNQPQVSEDGWAVTANPVLPYSDYFNLSLAEFAKVLRSYAFNDGGKNFDCLTTSLHMLATTGNLPISAAAGDQKEYADTIARIYLKLDGDDFAGSERRDDPVAETRGKAQYARKVQAAVTEKLKIPRIVVDYMQKEQLIST